MNFDFLKDDTPTPSLSREPETYEDRDPGLVDGSGRRITYSIRRMVHRSPPYPTMHLRWVYVLKDNETVREIDGNWHETYEAAEEWVEEQIAKSMAGYRRRGSSLRTPRARRKQGSGWRFVLLVLAIIVAVPFVAVAWLSFTLPR